MDKYSWFQSIKWMEKSNYNTFWHSAEPWLSLSISWDENNKLECESFCSIFTYVWALSCNFCLIYNSQDDNNTRRTWIGSGCFKSLINMYRHQGSREILRSKIFQKVQNFIFHRPKSRDLKDIPSNLERRYHLEKSKSTLI